VSVISDAEFATCTSAMDLPTPKVSLGRHEGLKRPPNGGQTLSAYGRSARKSTRQPRIQSSP